MFLREYESENFDSGLFRIVDESISLAGISYFELDEPLVDVNTVRVTDPSNTLVYVEGVDYMLRETGAITEIRVAQGTYRPDLPPPCGAA